MISFFRRIKNSFDNFTVKSKLMTIIMVVTAVCTVFALISFTYLSVVNIKDQMRSNISATGLIVANRVNAALMFDNNSAAYETLNSLSFNKSIEQACIYDGEKNVFAKYTSSKYVTKQCPEIEPISLYFTDDSLRLFSPITDQFNNKDIGYLFIESDLTPVYSYLTKQTLVGLLVIFIVLVIAYLLSLKLQKIISKPLHYILDKNSQNSSLFMPSDEYHTSKNEFSKMDMLMRAVMTRIAYLENQNQKSQQAYQELMKNSESTFNYLVDELKQPVEATIAFADIISSRAIGPVDDEYVSYYNDVYFTVFYYYGIINDSMKLFKEHASLDSTPRGLVDFSALLNLYLNEIKAHKPDFIQDIDFYADYKVSGDISKVIIDKIIVKELIYNSIFVFSKYLAFLEKKEMHIIVSASVNSEDKDAQKFQLEISCEELMNESVSEFLENHRKYQNDVHMLRSKLQFMKFLAKYDGGYLDFGNDLRKMNSMIIMFPLAQLTDTSSLHSHSSSFNIESLLKEEALPS